MECTPCSAWQDFSTILRKRQRKTCFVSVLVVATLACVMLYTMNSWRNRVSSVFLGQIASPWASAGTTAARARNITIWSMDYHISPTRDVKTFLAPLGVEFIDKSLSYHCPLTGTCAKGLKVQVPIEKNVSRAKEFYEAYKDDPEMKTVDAFICFHPSAMCEVYMPFGKPLLVIASTRYEMGRWGEKNWGEWNNNLKQISRMPGSVVAGNNVYDAEYIKYFTGLNVSVITSFCGYLEEKYNATRPEFLLHPSHNPKFNNFFNSELRKMYQDKLAVENNVTVQPIRKLYNHYKYSDLTAHRAIVYTPYQVSVMSMFEHYRMEIPLLFPSERLLAEWQVKYHVMNERTWDMTYGMATSKSALAGVQPNISDPNNEQDLAAIKYWIKFSDFYQFPHIVLYDSMTDLLQKLVNTDFLSVSKKMREFNAKEKVRLTDQWKGILQNIARAGHFKVLNMN